MSCFVVLCLYISNLSCLKICIFVMVCLPVLSVSLFLCLVFFKIGYYFFWEMGVMTNEVQKRGHELGVRALLRVGASGPAKQRFWSQFGATLTSLGIHFESVLGQLATKNVSRIDPLCLCSYETCTNRAGKTSAYNTHGKARWRNTRACALDTFSKLNINLV